MKTVQEYYYSHAKYYSGHIKWPDLSEDAKNYWNIYFHRHLAKKREAEVREEWLSNLAAECSDPFL